MKSLVTTSLVGTMTKINMTTGSLGVLTPGASLYVGEPPHVKQEKSRGGEHIIVLDIDIQKRTLVVFVPNKGRCKVNRSRVRFAFPDDELYNNYLENIEC